MLFKSQNILILTSGKLKWFHSAIYIEYDSSIHYNIKCEDIDSPIGYLGERTLSDWDFKSGIVWKTFEDYKNKKVERWPIKEMRLEEVDKWLDNWEKEHLENYYENN